MGETTDLTYLDIADTFNEHFPEFAADVDERTSFDDLDLDSLVLVELGVVLLKRYDVRLSEDDIVGARDFRTLAALVNERRRADSTRTAG
ncbi:phosphopantetheine-binding protein [Actinosynnema sp. NPDC004786]